MRKRKMLGKWKLVFVVVFLAGALIVMNGCAIIVRRPRAHRVADPSASVHVVYVQKAPPAVIVETPPPKPTARAVWISGYWRWSGVKYVWVPGHWDKSPRGRAWVPGEWKKTPRGWVWSPGHWQ